MQVAFGIDARASAYARIHGLFSDLLESFMDIIDLRWLVILLVLTCELTEPTTRSPAEGRSASGTCNIQVICFTLLLLFYKSNCPSLWLPLKIILSGCGPVSR